MKIYMMSPEIGRIKAGLVVIKGRSVVSKHIVLGAGLYVCNFIGLYVDNKR